MIIKEFSEYLKKFETEIPAVELVPGWVAQKLSKPPENNVDKVLQKEIALFRNRKGIFLLFGRSDSGRMLLESLHEFALSYDSHRFSKWVHNVKASDFSGRLY